ncbi:MAG: radical SAM protein [Lachnospiraceae bacterium]|jgi:biotin synthase|nr:radical SAM protein [Lachnospiraceae bacterium]
MTINTRNEVLELLKMPDDEFNRTIRPKAVELLKDKAQNTLYGAAMLGYSNICRCKCLYCGMRAPNSGIKRYRLTPPEVEMSITQAKELGFSNIFFVSGEDLGYGFENVLKIIDSAKSAGLFVSLAGGEWNRSQFFEMKEHGLDEYVLKFEMSDPETFNRLNPSTSFEHRMESIGWIKEASLYLASGNIIDFPGQTLEQLADDIWLMKELNISWAPLLPFLPAVGTPLANEGGPGRLSLLYKEISLTRILLPDIKITAQQPSSDPSKGLATYEGNMASIEAGANMLFYDLLSDALAKNFVVVDNRSLAGIAHMEQLAKDKDMKLFL